MRANAAAVGSQLGAFLTTPHPRLYSRHHIEVPIQLNMFLKFLFFLAFGGKVRANRAIVPPKMWLKEQGQNDCRPSDWNREI